MKIREARFWPAPQWRGKDKKFQFALKIGWRALAEGGPTKTFPNWRCDSVSEWKIRNKFSVSDDFHNEVSRSGFSIPNLGKIGRDLMYLCLATAILDRVSFFVQCPIFPTKKGEIRHETDVF